MILAAGHRQNPPARGPRYVAQASSSAGSAGVSPPEWRRGPTLKEQTVIGELAARPGFAGTG